MTSVTEYRRMSATADLKPSPRAAAAPRYADKLRWPVAPAHHILPDGRCSCGKLDCPSPGKHPLTPNGFKDATTDAEAIRHWWTQYPQFSGENLQK